MDEQLQKLILAQLEELTKISRGNQLKLERVDAILETMQETRKKDDELLQREVLTIEARLDKLEKFQVKLIVFASTIAFVFTILWEMIAKAILPVLI